jgi:hypothetical protein
MPTHTHSVTHPLMSLKCFLQRRKSRRARLFGLVALIAATIYFLCTYQRRTPPVMSRQPAMVTLRSRHSRSMRPPRAHAPHLKLSPAEELAAVSHFLASLPQNAIPHSTDPMHPIDPSVVLDFDTRHPDAAVELKAIMQEVWVRNPVILFCLVRYFEWPLFLLLLWRL